ncbi:MAG: hypothetical protein CMI79_02150 [Candidatus Pelagibacter sp.]|nr:hypothetical protein [Candidatus Pelagibacter sp.]|tara:strand:- start:2236 stop:2706 length:471 start_codon:yes stop_codon:yes gene_type:complete
MINNLLTFLTYENIYYIANIGVIPCWLLLIVTPNHIITKFFVKSVIIPLLLSTAYIFIIYQIYITENIFEIFNLYLGINELYALFSNEAFLLIFWLHFLSINLFVGNWIASDAKNYLVSKFLIILALITTYFTGPIGLVFYWLIRIFYSKKINYYD